MRLRALVLTWPQRRLGRPWRKVTSRCIHFQTRLRRAYDGLRPMQRDAGSAAQAARCRSERAAAARRATQPRRHTRQRLFAGIAASSCSTRPCACASAATASKSRIPLAASRAFSQASKARLLSLLKLPP